ncbi:UNVERIFIED_CONTAM: hypothetical protein FKN15_076878 [Acipenser sinensis]
MSKAWLMKMSRQRQCTMFSLVAASTCWFCNTCLAKGASSRGSFSKASHRELWGLEAGACCWGGAPHEQLPGPLPRKPSEASCWYRVLFSLSAALPVLHVGSREESWPGWEMLGTFTKHTGNAILSLTRWMSSSCGCESVSSLMA